MNCTVKANIITENKNNILCRKCQGSCWVPGNNSETQKRANEMFGGITPNNCVVSENGTPQCPYSK